MRINISFNLSDAKILTIAKEKGYQEIISTAVDPFAVPITFIDSPNPQTPDQFLKSTYIEMIKGDLKAKLLSNEETIDLRPRRLLKQQQILDIVDASFI